MRTAGPLPPSDRRQRPDDARLAGLDERRPGPTYPPRWILAWHVLRHLLTHPEYIVRRRKYPFFRLRALLTPLRKGHLYAWRASRLGRHYYGASLRTPRWPSPAFDRMIANGGMNVAPGVVGHKHHLDTAILAITRRCSYMCEHCYDAFNRADDDVVPVERWIGVTNHLERRGVGVIILSGGEPMLRYEDLLTILEHSDPQLTDIHLHSSGAGVTPARAEELAGRGLVAAGIGLDFPDPERQDRFRRHPGAFANAVQALQAFSDAGVFTYTNLCLTREVIIDDGLYRYLDLARKLRVGVVHLLEPKPCGRYGSRAPADLLSEGDRDQVLGFFKEVNQAKRYAGHPPVAYHAHFERPENYGCQMGGVGHLSIDSQGDVNPCVFVPVSFGNIMREDLGVILDRMRAANPGPRYRECPAVSLSPAIAFHRQQTGRPVVRFGEVQSEWDQELSRG